MHAKWFVLAAFMAVNVAVGKRHFDVSTLHVIIGLQVYHVAAQAEGFKALGTESLEEGPVPFEEDRRLMNDDLVPSVSNSEVETGHDGAEFVTAQRDPTIPPELEGLDLKAFDSTFTKEDTITKLIESAYKWVVHDRGYDDGYMRARDLPDFFHRMLNPADEDIDDEERVLLNKASERFRKEQGLLEDDMILYEGFLSRGGPMRYSRLLAEAMHVQHRARRLEAAKDL